MLRWLRPQVKVIWRTTLIGQNERFYSESKAFENVPGAFCLVLSFLNGYNGHFLSVLVRIH